MAVFLLVVVLIEIFTNIPEDRGCHSFINTNQYGLSLAGGFVSFAFSYGAHAVVRIFTSHLLLLLLLLLLLSVL